MITFPAATGAVLNEKTKSPAIWSGGSSPSVSEISAAATVSVHVVLKGSEVTGWSVNAAAGDAVCVKICGDPAGHWSENAPAFALTLSLKLTTISASIATLAAPLAGVVVTTVGAASTGGPAVVKENVKSEVMLSGGSVVSVSEI